jgi:Plasmid pRiA4b ORF-3-like protein
MIWRRLLVPAHMPLARLHQTIQLTLNWEDEFQYAFKIHGKTLSNKHANSNGDASEVCLQDFHLQPGERFLYEYNYFSFWEFDIRLEKALPFDEKKAYPLCVAGHGDAPPENVGGPLAYHRWLEQRWSSENLHAIDTLEHNMKPVIQALLTIKDDAKAGRTARSVINREEVEDALDQLKPSAWMHNNPFERKAVNEKLRSLGDVGVSKNG